MQSKRVYLDNAAATRLDERVLEAMRDHPYGWEAQVIGAVTGEHPGRVALRTVLGTRRVVNMLTGEQLPRIC